MENNKDSSFRYWSKANKWFINAYNKSFFEKIIHSPVKRREELAVISTRLTNSKTILDLGCGPCRVLSKCLSEGKAEKAFGIDFSRSMIVEAESHINQEGISEKVLIKQANLLELDSYPNSDLAIALGLFDYINDPLNIIKKTHLSSNYLVASWPGKNLRNYLRRFRYSCPVYTYDISEVSSMFNKIGITDLHFIDLGGFSGFLTISCSA